MSHPPHRNAKTWHDRVVARLRALEARDEADKQTFGELCTYMTRPQAHRDHERLDVDTGEARMLYKERTVFSFAVQKGEIEVRSAGQQPERYADREEAIDRMADLLAHAAHDPNWGQRMRDRQFDEYAAPAPRKPLKPLYPV